jgi:DNA-binding protein Fis
VVLDELLKSLLDQALLRSGGNKSRAADLLGIHRDQVRYWVKKYELDRWIRRAPASGVAADDEL